MALPGGVYTPMAAAAAAALAWAVCSKGEMAGLFGEDDEDEAAGDPPKGMGLPSRISFNVLVSGVNEGNCCSFFANKEAVAGLSPCRPPTLPPPGEAKGEMEGDCAAAPEGEACSGGDCSGDCKMD